MIVPIHTRELEYSLIECLSFLIFEPKQSLYVCKHEEKANEIKEKTKKKNCFAFIVLDECSSSGKQVLFIKKSFLFLLQTEAKKIQIFIYEFHVVITLLRKDYI